MVRFDMQRHVGYTSRHDTRFVNVIPSQAVKQVAGRRGLGASSKHGFGDVGGP